MVLNLYPYQLNALQDILEENNIKKIPERNISRDKDLLVVHLTSEMAESAIYTLLFEAMCTHEQHQYI